jgi:hypothetical protein
LFIGIDFSKFVFVALSLVVKIACLQELLIFQLMERFSLSSISVISENEDLEQRLASISENNDLEQTLSG